MNFHALAKAPSPTQALKIETYRGQIKPAFFLQQPPDKRMTRIGVGGPQNQSIFEEVSNFKMKFYRAAPFLGPFSGTKWVHFLVPKHGPRREMFMTQFAAPTQPPSERLARPPATSSSTARALKLVKIPCPFI